MRKALGLEGRQSGVRVTKIEKISFANGGGTTGLEVEFCKNFQLTNLLFSNRVLVSLFFQFPNFKQFFEDEILVIFFF